MTENALENKDDNSLVFVGGADDAGVRLDAYLAARVEGWSRSRLQRLITDGDVLVNGKTAKPSYKLNAGDEIDLDLTEDRRRGSSPRISRSTSFTRMTTLRSSTNRPGWSSTREPEYRAERSQTLSRGISVCRSLRVSKGVSSKLAATPLLT